jgi:hypothetical protein
MKRKLKEAPYYYLTVKIEYGSKDENDWCYRPKAVLLILSKSDLDKLVKYKELVRYDPAFKNDEEIRSRISYPVTVEEVWYQEEEEDIEDDFCSFNPEGAKICISGGDGYTYFSMYSSGDCWDIVEGDIDIDLLKPVVEWENYKPNLNLEI